MAQGDKYIHGSCILTHIASIFKAHAVAIQVTIKSIKQLNVFSQLYSYSFASLWGFKHFF